MKVPSPRIILATIAAASALPFAFAANAGAVTLSTPNGMKTISNTPELSWSTLETEIADQVRVSKSGAVDATGMLTSRYTGLADDELTTSGLTGGSTKEWASSGAAPLWPGTYFWQVHSVTTNADGTQTAAWSEVRKVIVRLYFGGLGTNDSLMTGNGSSVSTTLKLKMRTNAKSVPFHITYALNGHVYGSTKHPFTRISDIGQLVATVSIPIKLKASYYRRGTNTVTANGYIGSKASTGKVIPIHSTDTFKL